MRYWVGGAAIAGMAVALLAGCESDSSSKGFSSVTITGEEEQTVSGNLCAVRGTPPTPGTGARGCASRTRPRTPAT